MNFLAQSRVVRRCGALLLIVLYLTAAPLLAQEGADGEALTVVGSGIITPVLEAAAAATDTPLNVTVTGTTPGLETFCRGEADLVAAARALSAAEEIMCSSSGVTFTELLLGYTVLAFIAAPDSATPICLTLDQIETVFAPSAVNQITDWAQISEDTATAPFTVVLPPENTPIADLLDTLVSGVGFRADVQRTADVSAALAADPSALGVVALAEAAALGDAVRVINVNAGPGGCMPPSAEAVSNGTYPAAATQYLYVTSTALAETGTADFLTAVVSDPAALTARGTTAPTADESTANLASITAAVVGRTFSRVDVSFAIPTDVAGTVTLGGTASGAALLTETTNALSGLYPGVTVTSATDGQLAGVRRFCNGELDLVLTFSDLDADQTAACAARAIASYPVALGRQAVILLGNAATDYLQCLTTTQIVTAFSAIAADTATSWDQVDTAFPAQPLTLFTPSEGSPLTDLLLLTAGVPAMPSRADIELSDDAAYRAAAVGNVEGALAVLSWQEYQDVLTSGQANVRVVSVDAGNGCVEPTFASIANGDYPLSRPVTLLASTAALARPEVQSVLWYLLSDANFGTIEAAGLIGLTFTDLGDIRTALQTAFNEAAAAAAAAPTPEATPEATPAS